MEQGIIAGNHGGRRDRDNGGHLAMAPTSMAARIAQGAQGLEQALGLASI
jgi:hypothetical protein